LTKGCGMAGLVAATVHQGNFGGGNRQATERRPWEFYLKRSYTEP
jgi:hypothetical protein